MSTHADSIPIQLLDDTNDAELASFLEPAPVFLVGSFISMYRPTKLPSGKYFCDQVYSLLFDSVPGPGNQAWPIWFREDFDRIPFEALMELYPNQSQLPAVILALYGTGGHNGLHASLCSSVAAGRIASLITTNYDLAFDECLENTAVRKVVSERDWRALSLPLDRGVYFKIHGSAEPGLEDTLVFNLGREGLLSDWKRNLLTSILANRRLIVVAYSGRDFEICPELALNCPLRQVIWLQNGIGPRPPMHGACSVPDPVALSEAI
jgi:hypothetical protein